MVSFFIFVLEGENAAAGDMPKIAGILEKLQRGEGPSRMLNRRESSLPGGDPPGSAMEWQGPSPRFALPIHFCWGREAGCFTWQHRPGYFLESRKCFLILRRRRGASSRLSHTEIDTL